MVILIDLVYYTITITITVTCLLKQLYYIKLERHFHKKKTFQFHKSKILVLIFSINSHIHR